MNWDSGVDRFQCYTEDDVCHELGFDINNIPSFNRRHDPDSIVDPWTPEGSKWLADLTHGNDLRPRWHQLVGLLKMVNNFFDGLPILLMDGVGLGKTIQITMLCATLDYYRTYYDAHGIFPGISGMNRLSLSRCMF